MVEQHGQSTRSGKRSAPQATSEPTAKRRAPYAAKACDSCRRRKGRCDGRRPCEFCLSRSSECSYSETSDERPLSVSDSDGAQPIDKSLWTPDTVKYLGDLVAGLQGQLNSLAAQAGPTTQHAPDPELPQHDQPQPAGAEDCSSVHVAFDDPPRTVSGPGESPTKHDSVTRGACTGQGFCGPTSPEYSLNVAQMRMGQGKYSTAAGLGCHGSPSLDESQHTQDGSRLTSPEEDGWAALDPSVRRSLRHSLLRFQTMLPKREALRLIRVYKEVIGELHPFVDCDRLAEQTEGWYNWPGGGSSGDKGDDGPLSDEDSLLILNLVLSIALCAESGCQSDDARGLHKNCRGTINIFLALPVTGLRHVLVTLLVGLHHFFNDRPRLAWRMCGLAGRMAMEIGLHSRDVYQQYLETDEQQEEAEIISTSLIVLDRQWSAATGLPSNFQLSDFDYADASSTHCYFASDLLGIVSQAKSPYLKAMMSFTIMSQKFNEPICRVATGGTYEDDDAFEVTNFQIEQWRKRSLEKQNFTHPSTWQASPPANMPSWTIILYLRANAVRGILLRPFFLSSSLNTESSKRSIGPGLDIVSDTVNILSTLDRSTDIYRKQHPFLQHFLVSACALLFLIIAFADQKCGASSSSGDSFPAESWDAVGRNFMKAFALASAYSDSSRMSRKLFDRLVMLKEPLTKLGILPREGGHLNNDKASRTPATHQHLPASVNGAARPESAAAKVTTTHAPHQQPTAPSYGMGESLVVGHPGIEGAGDGTGISEADTYVNTSTGLFDSFMVDWSANDMNFFCSDGGL